MHAYLMISRTPGAYKLMDDLRKLKTVLKLNINGPFEVYGLYDVIIEAKLAKDVFDLYRNFIVPIIDIPSVGSCATYVVVKAMEEKPNGYPIAYLAIDTIQSREVVEEVQEEVGRIDCVQRSDVVLGPYDIIARVSCSRKEFPKNLSKIQQIPGVNKTYSYFVEELPRLNEGGDT